MNKEVIDMSFYRDFSSYYEQIFPVSLETISFFKQIFPVQGTVLDLGCGTGGYAYALAQMNYQVQGIDFDQGMIDIARRKNANLDLSISFKQGNMLELDEIDTYDGIYCIGNTLVHLNNHNEIFEVLGKIYDALKPEGTFILQIVNYDRILNHKISSLPTIKNNDLEFIRNYQFNGTKIRFLTELKTNEGNFTNSVELLPIRQNELFKMMTQIGFYEVRSFGKFDFSPFDMNSSLMLVMKGTKK